MRKLLIIIILIMAIFQMVVMAKTITTNGSAQVDTAIVRLGTGSLLGNNNGYLSVADHADFGFGTGDFTVDYWIKGTGWIASISNTTNQVSSDCVLAFYTASDIMYVYAGGWAALTGAIDNSEWQHVAVVRASGTMKLYVQGSEIASVSYTTNMVSKPLSIGTLYTYTNEFTGNIDEFRISKGLARWTSGFTPPTSAYSCDINTHLLVHCDGVDESTNFYDDDTIPSAGNAIFFGINF